MATGTKAKPARSDRPEKESKRPVHEERLGRITAAVWRNETTAGTRHNITVSRIYTDDEGNWHRSASFGRDDLPLVAKVLDRVHSWIFEQGREQPEGNDGARQESHDDIPY